MTPGTDIRRGDEWEGRALAFEARAEAAEKRVAELEAEVERQHEREQQTRDKLEVALTERNDLRAGWLLREDRKEAAGE